MIARSLGEPAAIGAPRRFHSLSKESVMASIAKVIEVIAESEQSFDDAVESALKEASKTVENIKSIWVDNMTAMVENDRITHYRVNAKVTFVVKGHD
jgi:dodecin